MKTIKKFVLPFTFVLGLISACAPAPDPGEGLSKAAPVTDTSDKDLDGVPNLLDNCIGIFNPDQLDTDNDGFGNACDPDDDGDDVLDGDDNCPINANRDQANQDGGDGNGDAFGDECDSDDDSDGVLDVSDNCPHVWNPLGLDLDEDHFGDACDNDCDDDNIPNFTVGNNVSIQDCRGQALDRDGDGFFGDVDCRDDNFDIHPNANDLCDGIDNNCDGTVDENLVNCVPFPPPDGDGDGVPDVLDNCPLLANENQHDADGDLIGDVCDDNQAPACVDNADCAQGEVCANNACIVINECPDCQAVECNVDLDCGNIALVCVNHFCVDAPPPPPVCDPNDTDCDGILDVNDLCPNVVDDGVDTDGDGQGDECDDCPNFVGLRNQCGQCALAPSEICDGIDNNCDGTIDEGFGLGVACNNGQQGECARSGTIVCGAGVAVCSVNQVMPGIEVCNGLDDDCNGTVDNGVLNACGVCGAVPAEVCDNLDNDCDGSIDEGVLNACGGCGPVGEEVCDGFDNDCDQAVDEGLLNACGQCGAVPVEICDNLDNDCDGTIDEGVKNACNQCGAVPAEVCDGIDNNCNGQVDDGVLNACGACGAVPAEVCDTVDNDCDGTIDEGVKNACNTCGPVPQEICNGQDDDCNGVVDNGVLNACGQCGAVPVEICDNIDNDCDGTIDDGVKNACGACGAVPAEVCLDNVDNDCDGQTDEGCDDDTDGVQDQLDNCPDDWNPAQGDRNENSIGNVCDRPDCEVTLLTENGKFFEYNQSSVNNVDPDENPAAPWITRTAGTREICVRRGEVTLFTATDANAVAYALTSTPVCDENQITENAGYFHSPNRPNDFAQYCTKICAFGPDWRCRVPAN